MSGRAGLLTGRRVFWWAGPTCRGWPSAWSVGTQGYPCLTDSNESKYIIRGVSKYQKQFVSRNFLTTLFWLHQDCLLSLFDIKLLRLDRGVMHLGYKFGQTWEKERFWINKNKGVWKNSSSIKTGRCLSKNKQKIEFFMFAWVLARIKDLRNIKNIATLYPCVFNMQNKIEPTIMESMEGSNRI
jgi:hypothetical protein